MGLVDRVLDFFGLASVEVYEEDDQTPTHTPARLMSKTNTKANTKSITNTIVLVEPKSYEQVQDIANYLLQNKIAIVSTRSLNDYDKQRLIDFLAGTIYVLQGDMQTIPPHILVCVSANVDMKKNGLIADDPFFFK